MAHLASTSPPGLGILLGKLERRGSFSVPAKKAFLGLSHGRRSYGTQRDIVREGDLTTKCRFLERGTVSRSKLLPNGGRQIAAFYIAGDLMDLPSALLLVADSTLRTHAPSVVIEVAVECILRVAEDFPEIGRAFWFDTLVDASIFREWSLNLGRRNAREKMAHLLMEIGYRIQEAELGSTRDFPLAITQVDLADAVGLTPVHVNRTMKWLRQQGYIDMPRGRIVIPDWNNLADFCAFRPLYLHPEGPRPLRAI